MKLKTVQLYQYFGLEQPEGARGELQLWIPTTPESVSLERQVPGVLVIPGGGYCHVSAREAEPVALQFVAKGYLAAVLWYSITPFQFPTALRESVLAMRYLRENAKELGLNPHQIAAIGFSAGGHLCGTLGLLYDCPEVADLVTGDMARPDALGLCYPVGVSWCPTHEESFLNISGGDKALRERLSLDKLVRPEMPPTYIWHTRDDGCVPAISSLHLATAMQEQGIFYQLHIYAHGGHGVSTADALSNNLAEIPEVSPNVLGWVEEMLGFFKEIGFAIQDLQGRSA